MAEVLRGIADAAERETAPARSQSIDRAVADLGRRGRTVEGFSGTIRSLGERSRQIGQIVGLVTGIADQLKAAVRAFHV